MNKTRQLADRGWQATRKNLLINGCFRIWQRATTQTSASSFGSDDRWGNSHNGSTKTHSRQAFTIGQTDVPGGPQYYSRTVVTSVAGAANQVHKYQAIEDVGVTAEKTITISFWAKADSAKNIATEFWQVFGAGGSSSVTGVGIATHALTTSWQRFTATATMPSVSGKTFGTVTGSGVAFWFDAGSDNDARTNSLGQQSGTFDIAQVQIEIGSEATEFEHRPIGDEIVLCQRYFCKSYRLDVDPGTADVNGSFSSNTTSGGSDNMSISFPTTMRTNPSVTIYAPDSGTSNRAWQSADVTLANVDRISESNIGRIRVSGVTASNTWRVHYVADAEL